jgi:hypothetical protein
MQSKIKYRQPILRILFLLFISGAVLRTRGQATDSLFPPAHTLVPDPNVKSPFKTIIVLRPLANGHKNTGTVDIAFTVGNQSTRIASLLFSTNPVLSKAADDLDSLYPISQLRFGTNKQDPGMPPSTVELHPDQTLHCGVYISNVPLGARYVKKFVLFTSLTLGEVSAGEDNIIFTDIPIVWK